MPPPGINTDGVSAGAIRSFLQGLETAFPEKHKDMTTQEACVEFVVPQTEEKQCAYIDVMRDQNGSDDVRPATVFVSHAWRYKIVDVLTTLLEFAEEEESKHGRKTHFWFDLFMNNQHQNVTANLPQEWWSTTFKDSIASIGKVLLVLTPWNNPVPLTRAWCLWEIFCSISQPEVELEIRLPKGERGQLRQALAQNFDVVTDALVDVQAEKAEAWKAEDRDMIFGAIRASVGFPALDEAVKNQMRQWCLQAALSFVDELEQSGETETQLYGLLCGQVGAVLDQFGEHERAIELHMKDLGVALAHGHEHSQDTGVTYVNLSEAHRSNGDYEQAAECGAKALAIFRATVGDEHPLTAKAYANIGSAAAEAGDAETGVTCCQRAVDILVGTLGEDHRDTACALQTLGFAHDNNGDTSKAVALYERAIRAGCRALGEEHPLVAQSYNSLGTVLLEGKQYADAIECFNKALAIFLVTVGEEHPSTAMAVGNLGNAYDERGDFARAVEYYERDLAIKRAVLGDAHPDIGLALANLGTTLVKQGHGARGVGMVEEAVAVFMGTLGPEHPFTVATERNLGIARGCAARIAAEQGGDGLGVGIGKFGGVVRMGGWLKKRGGRHKGFRTRFFRLTDTALTYCKSSRDGDIPRGHIPLEHITAVDVEGRDLRVSVPGRIYIMQCVEGKSSLTLEDWSHAITTAMEEAK